MNFKEDRLFYFSTKYPEYYFSRFYFTEEEIEKLIMFPTSSELTYKDTFDIFLKSKENSTEICTSHRISPFIYKTFRINKNFSKNTSFIKRYNRFKGIPQV